MLHSLACSLQEEFVIPRFQTVTEKVYVMCSDTTLEKHCVDDSANTHDRDMVLSMGYFRSNEVQGVGESLSI